MRRHRHAREDVGSTTEVAVRRAIWASAESSSRWASTGIGEGLQVVRRDVVALVECGRGAAGPQQLQGRPWRGAEPQVGVVAGRGHEIDGVTADAVSDVDRADRR